MIVKRVLSSTLLLAGLFLFADICPAAEPVAMAPGQPVLPAYRAGAPAPTQGGIEAYQGNGLEVPEANDRLQVILSPYAWAPGLKGKVGVVGPPANVNISSIQVIEHLQGALMGQVEVRKGRVGLLLEGFYSKLSADKGFRNDLVEANLTNQMLTLSAFLAYRLVETRKARLDLLAGARYWYMKDSIGLDLPNNSFSLDATASWVDPLVGARLGYDLTDRLSATVRGDLGGFGVGSKFAWEALAGLNYKFTERSTGFLGYRYMFADYQDGDFVFNAGMGGPIMGLGFSF